MCDVHRLTGGVRTCRKGPPVTQHCSCGTHFTRETPVTKTWGRNPTSRTSVTVVSIALHFQIRGHTATPAQGPPPGAHGGGAPVPPQLPPVALPELAETVSHLNDGLGSESRRGSLFFLCGQVSIYWREIQTNLGMAFGGWVISSRVGLCPSSTAADRMKPRITCS